MRFSVGPMSLCLVLTLSACQAHHSPREQEGSASASLDPAPPPPPPPPPHESGSISGTSQAQTSSANSNSKHFSVASNPAPGHDRANPGTIGNGGSVVQLPSGVVMADSYYKAPQYKIPSFYLGRVEDFGKAFPGLEV